MATRWLIFFGVLSIIVGLLLRPLFDYLLLYGLLGVGVVLIALGAIPEW